MITTTIPTEDFAHVFTDQYACFENAGMQAIAVHLMKQIDVNTDGIDIIVSGEETTQTVDTLLRPYLRAIECTPHVFFIFCKRELIGSLQDEGTNQYGCLKLVIPDDHMSGACVHVMAFAVKRERYPYYSMDTMVETVFRNPRRRKRSRSR